MTWKRRKNKASQTTIAVPAYLPAVAGLDTRDEYAPGHRPRTWLWTLLAALAVVLLVVYVFVLGVMAVVGGLRDRAVTDQQAAQEHYALGMAHSQAGEYELAMAEFKLAIRYDSSLREARTELRAAEEKALAQVTPTSQTRRDAVATLYQQATTAYQAGKLDEAVTALEELRGLDGDYQHDSVEATLIAAHLQLGQDAVGTDHLDVAEKHFQAVLALKADHADALNQLNLLHLYMAAISNWGQDWAATSQAFKGLYSLAPGYKDVRIRLHDAHIFRAEQYATEGNWCAASEEYAAAVSVLVLEATVDRRDDAALRCQATAEAPQPTATPPPTPTAPAGARTATPGETPASPSPAGPAGQGRIAFVSFDSLQQRYDVYVVDLAQGVATLLQENASQPALAPGGQRLAFRNRHPSHLGLSVTGPGTSEFTELTAHAEDSWPSWSPDAAYIAFSSAKFGDGRWRIYTISPGEVHGEGVQWGYGRVPSWSPDGKRLAYQGCDERADNCGIWLMKAGGLDPTRLTQDPSDTAPTWSPNGRQIAFISARSGNWELYVVDVASGREARLSDHRAVDVAPAWSPDGKKLAFLSNRDGAWAVYILDIASGRVHQVIATGDAYPEPVEERLSWGK